MDAGLEGAFGEVALDLLDAMLVFDFASCEVHFCSSNFHFYCFESPVSLYICCCSYILELV